MAQQSGANPKPSTLTELMTTLQLVWRLLNDPRVPLLTKAIVPGIVLYVLSPIDLIPDLIPLLGQLDDAAVIFLGIRFFIDLCPADVVMEHRRALAGEGGRGDYVDATYRVVDEDK
jgi:uncharacterized membrane protein YkvA (DUF1232 family)